MRGAAHLAAGDAAGLLSRMPTSAFAPHGRWWRRLGLVLAVAATRVPSVHAQRVPDAPRDDAAFSFYARGPYRPQVPRPDSLLGYALGTAHTQFHQQERTLLAIAGSARDRVAVELLGQTPERRTMRLYVVSAPENIAKLDAIRADLDRLADPRGVPAPEREALAARVPAVVWFSGSVHGDEVPGFEASMALLYHFAASDDPETVRLLKDAVVVINPSSNPDGHERFAVWSNAIAVGSPERQAMEQQRAQPWSIAGRYNHYRFDMNRDVFAQTQREVRHLVRGMLRWHPMVTADLHGFTSTYFMAPASRPVNANISGWPVKWGEIIGAANAAAFDAFGWMYFVRDNYDLYYPGYWDSWPSLTGALGATYETDGGPALLKRRADGTLLSLRDGIAKHYVAAVTTFETTARRARERVRDYAAFRLQAIDAGRTQPMKRVVFAPGNDPARAAELATTLLRNGIEVQRLTAPLASTRARAYADDAVAARTFAAGHYVVDLAQPQGRLARALLEAEPQLDAVFAKRMADAFRRNRERASAADLDGYEFYDITAWALPVAYGVEAWSLEDAAPMQGEPLRLPADDAPRVNDETLPVAVAGGVVGGARARSAYLFRNDRNGAARLAGHLMGEGFRVAIATEPVQVAATTWPRGTWVVRVSRNDSTLHGRIDALARAAGVEVTAAGTAFPESAQYGTGSAVVRDLPAAKVALVGGDGIFQGGYGAIWWTLETRYALPFTPITTDALNGDLSPFTAIIVPTGSLSRLGKAAGLRTWIERGGTLITMGDATAWAAREDVNLTSARAVEGDKKDPKSGDAPKPATDTAMIVQSPGAGANADTPAPVPGSHFDVVFDRTHWLTLGIEQPRMTVLLESDTFLRLSKDGTNVGVFAPTGPLLRGGFTFPDNTERLLRGTAYLIHEKIGAGHLVAFANEPMFRGWWRALDRLVMNAVLLGGGF